MNTDELGKDIIGGSIIATIISLVVGVFTGILVTVFKEFTFFLRPENAHYTEYNTPHAVYNDLLVQGFQDPLTLVMMLIPYVLLVTALFLFYKSGDYL